MPTWRESLKKRELLKSKSEEDKQTFEKKPQDEPKKKSPILGEYLKRKKLFEKNRNLEEKRLIQKFNIDPNTPNINYNDLFLKELSQKKESEISKKEWRRREFILERKELKRKFPDLSESEITDRLAPKRKIGDIPKAENKLNEIIEKKGLKKLLDTQTENISFRPGEEGQLPFQGGGPISGQPSVPFQGTRALRAPGQPIIDPIISEIFKEKTIPLSEVAKGAILTFPKASWQLIKDYVTPFLHLGETFKTVTQLAVGLIQKLTPGVQPTEEQVNQVAEYMTNRYGGIEEIKRTISTDLPGVAADVASLFTGGAAILGKVGKIAKISRKGKIATTIKRLRRIGEVIEPLQTVVELGKLGVKISKPAMIKTGSIGANILGTLPGLGKVPITEAVKSGDKFWKILTGDTPVREILKKTEGALDNIKKERGIQYEKRLKELKKSTISLDKKPFFEKLRDQLEKFNIKTSVADGQVIADVRNSDIDLRSIGDTEKVIDIMMTWDDFTPFGMDRLKKRLGQFYSESKNSRTLVTAMYNKAKEMIGDVVPEYAKMTRKYENDTILINSIAEVLSIGKKTKKGKKIKINPDEVMRKISTVFKNNSEYGLQLIDELNKFGGGTLRTEISAALSRSWKPRDFAGKITNAAAILSGIANVDPKLFLILAVSSPKAVTGFINRLATLYRKSRVGLKRSPKPFIPTTQKLFQAGRAQRITQPNEGNNSIPPEDQIFDPTKQKIAINGF